MCVCVCVCVRNWVSMYLSMYEQRGSDPLSVCVRVLLSTLLTLVHEKSLKTKHTQSALCPCLDSVARVPVLLLYSLPPSFSYPANSGETHEQIKKVPFTPPSSALFHRFPTESRQAMFRTGDSSTELYLRFGPALSATDPTTITRRTRAAGN